MAHCGYMSDDFISCVLCTILMHECKVDTYLTFVYGMAWSMNALDPDRYAYAGNICTTECPTHAAVHNNSNPS